MGRYGRARAVVPVRMTPEVCAPWRDLVALAAAAALVAPSSAVPALAAAARVSRQWVVPGLLTDDNPCIRLARIARRYTGETTAGRRAMQGELAARADAAAEYLDGEDAARAAMRKDIDG